jgi:hypothetical protein
MMEVLRRIQVPSSTIVELIGVDSSVPDLSGLVNFFDRFFVEKAAEWNIDRLLCTGDDYLNLQLYDKEARQTDLGCPIPIPA